MGDSSLQLKEGISEDMIQLYLEIAPDYLADLIRATNEGDFEQIVFQAHKLNSTMGLMGFEKISALLIDIERSGLAKIKPDNEVELLRSLVAETLELLNKDS